MKAILLFSITLTTSFCVLFPYQVECPKYSLIREAKNDLSNSERDYFESRATFSGKHLQLYLEGSRGDVNVEPKLLNSILETPPIFALAISGGGYRSMLTATGFIQELEHIGIFPCIGYISGLSGGSWTLLDLILHDFEPQKLLTLWNLETGLLEGIPEFDVESNDMIEDMENKDQQTSILKRDNLSNEIVFPERPSEKLVVNPSKSFSEESKKGFSVIEFIKSRFLYKLVPKKSIQTGQSSKMVRKIFDYYINLHSEVRNKKLKGFPLSFTDYWGKALLQRIIDKERLSKSTSLFELIRQSKSFVSYQAPVPIFIANCRNKGLKNFIFEFTPFEFGTWEKGGNVFVELQYLGSYIKNGISKVCFRQFDDIGFITATSSSIFNNVFVFVWTKLSQSSTFIASVFQQMIDIFGISGIKDLSGVEDISDIKERVERKADYAIYHPNPFFKYNSNEVKSSIVENNYLYLVDGGEDGENIPLRNLLIPARKVDTIFIMDSSSDMNNYANGTKLLNTLKRIQNKNFNYLPLGNISLWLQGRKGPKVLGCHIQPSSISMTLPPILIYYNNHQVVYPSNTSTFKAIYSKNESDGLIYNGKNIFHESIDNITGSIDKCLPCILVKRRLDKVFNYENYPKEYDICYQCFDNWCLT